MLVLKVAEKLPLLELMVELVAFWPSMVTVTVPVGYAPEAFRLTVPLRVMEAVP